MAAAFAWGALGASALLVGALIAHHLRPSTGGIAMVMALGTGLLIGSVAFELVDEALKTRSVAGVGLFVLVGAGVCTVGDWLRSRSGAADRKHSGGAQAAGSPWRSCWVRCWTGSRNRSCSVSPSCRAG